MLEERSSFLLTRLLLGSHVIGIPSCIDVKVIFLRRYVYVQAKEETLEKGTQMFSLNGIECRLKASVLRKQLLKRMGLYGIWPIAIGGTLFWAAAKHKCDIFGRLRMPLETTISASS